MITYLLIAGFCQLIFLAFYGLFLKKLTWFHFNRWYLLGALFLSLLLPMAQYYEAPVAKPEIWRAEVVVAPQMSTSPLPEAEPTAFVLPSVWQVVSVLFAGICLFFGYLFWRKMNRILGLIRQGRREAHSDFWMVWTRAWHAPFSWWKYLFWSERFETDPAERKQILEHELAHIREGHTLDVLFLEILHLFFWWNPVFYRFKRELRDVHEYLADAAALRYSSVRSYGQLLLRQLQGQDSPQLSHAFHSQIKKRIKMMTKTKSGRRSLWWYLPVMPLLIGLAFALTASPSDSAPPIEEELTMKRDSNIRPDVAKDARMGINLAFLAKDSLILKTEHGAEERWDAEKALLVWNGKVLNKEEKEALYAKGEIIIDKAIRLTGKEAVAAYGKAGEFGVLELWTDKSSTQKNSTKVLKVAEQMPRFPGCEEIADEQERTRCSQRKMLEYIYGNIQYPKEAREKGIEGMVVVSFVIGKEGIVRDAKVVRPVGGGCSEEALRVVNRMVEEDIRWIPGRENGEVVAVQFNLPIRFKMTDAGQPVKPGSDQAMKRTSRYTGDIPPPPPPPPPPPFQKESDFFKVADEMPRFPGCEEIADEQERNQCSQRKMLEYIYGNIHYPEEAREQGIEGMAVVSFVIGKEGIVRDAKVVRPVGGGCSEEALRVVNRMVEEDIRWIPGRENGEVVAVQFNLPIRFKLSQEEKAAEAETLEKENTVSSFRIHPNPNTGTFSLDYIGEVEGEVKVEMLDLQGRLLKEQELEGGSNTSWHLQAPEGHSGLLIVRLLQGTQLLGSQKLIVE